MSMWIKAAAAAAAGGLCLLRSQYERKALSIEEILLTSPKIKEDKTLLFLSDLHGNTFGPDNRQLLEVVDRIRPDGILSGGDMMVAKEGMADTRVPLALLTALAKKYPVFCGNGNHENRMDRQRQLYGMEYETYRDALRRAGVIYLEDERKNFGDDIQIGAVDLDHDFYRKALLQKLPVMGEDYLKGKLNRPDRSRYVILMAHTPMYFKNYAAWGADLSLCGHFHGGTIRIPGLGGVMTPQFQFFLPWCAGTFQEGTGTMVVSRGLGTHSINIRLNNRPQLVVLKLKRG